MTCSNELDLNVSMVGRKFVMSKPDSYLKISSYGYLCYFIMLCVMEVELYSGFVYGLCSTEDLYEGWMDLVLQKSAWI